MKIRTLVFLNKPDTEEILLAMKKRGFGEGKWNGVGGKVEEGESVLEAAIREANEEIGVSIAIDELEKVAELDFIFKENPDYDQFVYAYFVEKWDGKPSESEEMSPKWYKYNALPFKKMWIDDEHWLPRVIEGEKLTAKFTFNKDGSKLLSKDIVQLVSTNHS